MELNGFFNMWYIIKCKYCKNCLCARRQVNRQHKRYVHLDTIVGFVGRVLLQIVSFAFALFAYAFLAYFFFSGILHYDVLSQDTYCMLFVSGGAFILYVERNVQKFLFLTVESSSTDSK